MRSRFPTVACALFTATLLAAGCSSGDAGAPSDAPEGTATTAAAATPSPTLQTAAGIGLGNARMPMDGLVTAAQPTPRQMDALAAAGFRNFISLRPTGEQGAGWEEAHVQGAEYDFQRLPISGADDLTRERVEEFAALLDQAGDEPTVLYCASSNRVGAMLALKAFWLDGVPAEEALEIGRAGGLTRLEGAVRQQMGLEG